MSAPTDDNGSDTGRALRVALDEVADERPEPVGPAPRPLVVHPVGGQDLWPRDMESLGPFPSPEGFVSQRGGQRKVVARRWGQACLYAIRDDPLGRQAELVAEHLDAPILRRVLVEAVDPSTARVVLIVTDQDPAVPGGFADDDTVAFGQLLQLWLQGRGPAPADCCRLVDTVVIRRDPHLLQAVLPVLREKVQSTLEGCSEVVVVQAGGTPAMSLAALMAYTLHGSGLPVRHLYVALRGRLVEEQFPALIDRAQSVTVAQRFASRREPDAALAQLVGLPDIAPLIGARTLLELAGELLRRELPAVPRDRAEQIIAATPEQRAEQRVEQIGHLCDAPPLTFALRLAGWDALAAWERNDHARFLNTLGVIYQHLPGHWFLAHGLDPTAPHQLTAAFPEHQWHIFDQCHLAHAARGHARADLTRDQPSSNESTCAEIFRCLAYANGCTCGLGNAVTEEGLDGVHKAVTAWQQYEQSGLARLRNRSMLSHSLWPTPVADLHQAMHEAGCVADGVSEWLVAQMGDFGIVLDTDVVDLLCADAHDLLSATT